MNRTFAAAIVVVVLVTAGCTGGQGVGSGAAASPSLVSAGIASTSPAPTAKASPSQAPTPTTAAFHGAVPVGDLKAGTTYALGVGSPQRLLLTVPADGWFAIDTWFLGKDGIKDPDGRWYDMTLIPYQVLNVYTDPCYWVGRPLDPPVGPTVDDLAAALVRQAGPDAIAPTDVTIGGYSGKKVELSIPSDIDTGTCNEGDFGRWSPAGDPSWYGPFTYGKGQHDTVYIIDVQGTRWVIDTNYLPGTSKANLAELEQLVASIRFEP